MFYQKISRNNDINGNPFRLLMIYNSASELDKVVQVRESLTSNYEHTLIRQNYIQIMTLHVAPAEYNRLIRSAKHWGDNPGGIFEEAD